MAPTVTPPPPAAAQTSLLALAEATENVTRRAYPWAPQAALANGRAVALSALSAEALDEVAALVRSQGGDDGAAAAAATDVPAEATVVLPKPRAAAAAPEPRAVAVAVAVDDDDDDETDDDDDDDGASSDDDGGAAPFGLRVDARSSTVEAPVAADLALSLCSAFAGGCGFHGTRATRAATAAGAAARLAAAARAKRAGRGSVALIALRSGKFAGCVFGPDGAPKRHQVFSRYTTRRGQGGAQAAMDNTGRKVKSVGSTLRRAGERALAEEVTLLLRETWRADLEACEGVYVACARAMRPLLFGKNDVPACVDARDPRVQKIPFGLAKPTLAHVVAAYERLTTVPPRRAPVVVEAPVAKLAVSAAARAVLDAAAAGDEAALDAALAGDDALARSLDEDGSSALHLAAARGSPELALALLARGADPAARDGRGRVAFALCGDRRTRDAFVKARARLGEAAADWAGGAVPAPLDDEAVKAKKQREAEKKKRQRERQKQQKAEAKARAEADAEARAAADAAAKLKAAEDEKRNRCASCGGAVRGEPFRRLEFLYCASACVQAHRRELMAAAAEARFGKR
ncbi:hypothetical protein AURANDRAFT_63449 [Aureococcus anophagefferens]|uniref:VLRF1 domain-containing protein n=1 Tax=Aureococcus anophagefferens TaxID=44056 RepID=F0Y740_AURAN|nr:hypothetical protein AURANDRAFT_63449 [Aureococcus anophagefferens]EGB09279.1 hypothetical protein AURANDRAFT_63449 [Aureococcus anophagefferens]|eukprot:XP_009036381.1 hypothetical protein AURANDRAFT_63449 [Aureococcus anophagefferens]